ncbi:MAG TPA: hypothetical protein VFH48_09630 [Chloroflexota bacterium]|nr:hypothetical protein [Chloroflexota bacterium]
MYRLLTHGQLLVRGLARRTSRRSVASLGLVILVALAGVVLPAATPARASGIDRRFLPSRLMAAIDDLERRGEAVKHVAIGKDDSWTWVVLYGRNGFIAQGIPQGLTSRLNELNHRKVEINLVELGANDGWVVIYDREWEFHSRLPDGLERALVDSTAKGATIEYVMMDRKGHYFMRSSTANYWNLPPLADEQVTWMTRAGRTINGIMYGQVQCFEDCTGVIGYVIVFDGTKVWREQGCCIGMGDIKEALSDIQGGRPRVRAAMSGFDNSWAIFSE